MSAAVGTLAVTTGLGASVTGAVALVVGLRTGARHWLRRGVAAALVLAMAAVVAVAAMEWALVTHDFSLTYVAEHGSRSTPLLYTVASLWGALEGSILLWALILTVHALIFSRRVRRHLDDPVAIWALVVTFVVAAFFFALMAGPADPFQSVAGIPATDGPGPNPLLQNHPLMAIHPPMLYLGYVGFTIPFAIGMAMLVTGRVDTRWLSRLRTTTLAAWAFLTAGIVLGAWWSYEVLGWGGYFAWDPVENASLMPWFTATAYLHSVMVQQRRGLLRVWNLSLLIATFALTILGTFLTRSGVVVSVHAFSQSTIGPWLLAFLAVVVFAGVAGVAWRAELLRDDSRVAGGLSRERFFLGNNLLLAGFAFMVLVGTTYPMIVQVVTGRELSVGEPYFEQMGIPIGLALLTIMAVAPVLSWSAAPRDVVARRLRLPAAIGVATLVTAVMAGARGTAQVVAFALAAFVVSSAVQQFGAAVRNRRRARGTPTWTGPIVQTFRAGRRRYAGLLVHVGVAVIAVALAASQGYARRHEVHLEQGQTVAVDGYDLTYLGPTTDVTEQRVRIGARVGVARDGRSLGVREPALSLFPQMGQTVGTPSVATSLREDLYLTLISSPDRSGAITLGAFVNPLVVWLWTGGGIMVIGAAIGMWPVPAPRQRAAGGRRPARSASRREVPA